MRRNEIRHNKIVNGYVRTHIVTTHEIPIEIIDLCYKYYYIQDTFMFAFGTHAEFFVLNLDLDKKTKRVWNGKMEHQQNNHSIHKHSLSMQSQGYHTYHAQNVPIPN